MPPFVPGTKVETEDPSISVDVDPANPLPAGRHTFELIVVDEAGNASDPSTVEVIIRDSQKPTAVLDAPQQVEFGQSFALSGKRSSDVPPGKVVKFVWTMVG